MKFETRETSLCAGWQLANSVMVNGKRLPKTHTLSKEDTETLETFGKATLQVFQLETGDVTENEAALSVAAHIKGDSLQVISAGKGRANLIAKTDGLFHSNAAIDTLNQLDDAFSVASVSENATVQAGQLVATVKVVPYAIAGSILNTLYATGKQVQVRPFREYSVALVTSDPALTDKTQSVIKLRLAQTRGTLNTILSCRHSEEDIKKTIHTAHAMQHDVILVLGLSAITDARDIVPAATKAAGAKLVKVGLPTDPGNLLMLATLDDAIVIGLPGCAKSPALNGLDWVLARFAAGVDLDHSILTGFGVGGLLKEHRDRPNRRQAEAEVSAKAVDSHTDQPNLHAVVLAAGRSTRSGEQHKLFSKIEGQPVISKTVWSLKNALKHLSKHEQELTVVTGHRADEMNATLSDAGVSILHNPDYADGMGSSLAAAVRATPPDTEWLMVCLGDMPFIAPDTIATILDATRRTATSVIIPTFHGKRGHPVLWHKQHFLALSGLSGDGGGKALLQSEDLEAHTVAVQDPGILIDLDTPELLAQFGVVID